MPDNGILLYVMLLCWSAAQENILAHTLPNTLDFFFINIHPEAQTINLFNLITPSSAGTVF